MRIKPVTWDAVVHHVCCWVVISLSVSWLSSHVWAAEPIRLGIIGLDTSHAIAFTEALHDVSAAEDLQGCRIVAAYPPGSPDIKSSVERVPQYTTRLRELGVEIVPSIAELLTRVDGVLLETNDGRPHLEQLRPVLKAGKPVFIDKPIAGSLADAVRIFAEAKQAGVPLFSASSLRFSEAVQAARAGRVGTVTGCDAFSPCALEATHPDLFWYGIHGVEALFTAMGPGCERVVRMSSPSTDGVMGIWSDGRIGTFRGIRSGQGGYGATIFGTEGVLRMEKYDGYRPLVVELVKFFRTGTPPVSARETLEIYAFMEAADESKRRSGAPVTIAEVLERAGLTADALP